MARVFASGWCICLLITFAVNAQLLGPPNPTYSPAVEELLQQEAQETASETVADTVRNIFLKQPILPIEPMGSLGMTNYMGCVPNMERLPRIRKLLLIVREGTPEEKAKLKACLIEMGNYYINEAPLLTPLKYDAEGKPIGYEIRSSVAMPQNAVVYAYLLRFLDDHGDTLPLLVKMHQRQQEVLHQQLQEESKRAGRDPSTYPKEYVLSTHSVMLAFACARALRTLADDTARQSPLTQAQRDVLDQFKQLDAEHQAEWKADYPNFSSENKVPPDEEILWIDMDSKIQKQVLTLAEKYTSS